MELDLNSTRATISRADQHPEQRPGELFLCNATSINFHQFGWGSKRTGCVAYNTNGDHVNGLTPILISEEEALAYKDVDVID